MKFRQPIFLMFTLMVVMSGYSQKQTQHIQQAWVGYFNQVRFSDKWGLWGDLHLRTKKDFVTNLSVSIARVGITWHSSERLRFTAGYAFVNFFPADEHPDVSQPEHRPWQQVQWVVNNKRSRIVQTVRLEERFRRKITNGSELGKGYHFNYRARYNTLLMLPFGKTAFATNTLSGVVNNEVMINFGKQIVNNYFDQNRFFIGFAYHINSHNNIQFGYMNVFQQLASGNQYRSIHVPRIYFFQNLDLRKGK